MLLKESSTWKKSDLLKISFMASMACGSSSISMQCILRDMVCLLAMGLKILCLGPGFRYRSGSGSAAGAFEAVAFLAQDAAGLVPHIALQDDFPVFDRTAYAAAVLEQLAQGFQIGGGSYEASNQGHGLASPAFGVAQYAQILAGGFQGLGFGFFFVPVLEVGVGGIDHAYRSFLVHGFLGDLFLAGSCGAEEAVSPGLLVSGAKVRNFCFADASVFFKV